MRLRVKDVRFRVESLAVRVLGRCWRYLMLVLGMDFLGLHPQRQSCFLSRVMGTKLLEKKASTGSGLTAVIQPTNGNFKYACTNSKRTTPRILILAGKRVPRNRADQCRYVLCCVSPSCKQGLRFWET